MNKDHEGYFIRSVNRAVERRAKHPESTVIKSANIELLLAKPVLAALQSVKKKATKSVAIESGFDPEAYRLDIMARAITHILKQQKGI